MQIGDMVRFREGTRDADIDFSLAGLTGIVRGIRYYEHDEIWSIDIELSQESKKKLPKYYCDTLTKYGFSPDDWMELHPDDVEVIDAEEAT